MQSGFTLWFTGLSGAGKTTLSSLTAAALTERSVSLEVLDGDVVRQNLSSRLGFSKKDRDENVRRIGWLCGVLNKHGVVAIAAAISPYTEARRRVRADIPKFIEVFCDCEIDVLAARDPKGLYKRAMAGEIKHFTGIDDPYERPENAEIWVNTGNSSPEDCVAKILAHLETRQLIPSA